MRQNSTCPFSSHKSEPQYRFPAGLGASCQARTAASTPCSSSRRVLSTYSSAGCSPVVSAPGAPRNVHPDPTGVDNPSRFAAHSRRTEQVKRLGREDRDVNPLQGRENAPGPDALSEIKALRRLITVCAWCNRTRDSEGCWHRLDDLRAKSQSITHGICPECTERSYNDFRASQTEDKFSLVPQHERVASSVSGR
jgi:hypothetical protein